jgi:hypothetical protein
MVHGMERQRARSRRDGGMKTTRAEWMELWTDGTTEGEGMEEGID